MKVFIGASNITQPIEARRWVTLSRYKTLFSDLERWAVAREAQWGECYIFIEVNLPEGSKFSGRRGQIDLIISFKDRMAHCELKSYGSPNSEDIRKIYAQIDGQINWIQTFLKDGGYDTKALSSFLFLPLLNVNQLEQVAHELINIHAAHHIRPTGAVPELKGCKNHQHNSFFYLTESLEEKLNKSYSVISRGRTGIQHYLNQTLTNQSASLLHFSSFNQAIAYLNSISESTQLLHDNWYVPNLRSNELMQCMSLLKETGILQISGDPGIGKSTFIKEIIGRIGKEYYEVPLHKTRSIYSICRTINRVVRGDVFEEYGEEALLKQLSNDPYIFWVKEYDESSEVLLTKFLQKINALNKLSDSNESVWLIETVKGLMGLEEFCFQLPPLDNNAIYNILQNIDNGGAYIDPEDVQRLANGNPEKAIRVWQSRTKAEAKITDEYEWLEKHLSDKELLMLPVLCMSSQKSPLGFTVNVLCQWCSVLFNDRLITDIRSTINSLLNILEERRLVHITRLDRIALGNLPEEVIPENCSMVIINNLSNGLMSHFLSRVDINTQNEWLEVLRIELNKELNKSADLFSLAHVTLELNSYDLEPYFLSTFRFTFLRRIISWIDETNWRPINNRQTYLLKSLRILSVLDSEHSIDIESELEKPSNDDAIELMAYEIVKTRADLCKNLNNSFDLESWLENVRQCQKPDLQAELYVATAMSLQHSRRDNRSQETWGILNQLWDKYEIDTTERCTVIYQSLAYLNRTKIRKPKNKPIVVDDKNASDLIVKLSKELIATGLRLQNIQLVCDALFFYIRSQEFRIGRTTYSEVMSFLSGLRFIEEAQGRTVMRLQVLLTQGSVHRHYCRQEGLSWEEYLKSMEDGLKSYKRAYSSAVAQDHLLHILNAVSYMADFCMKALKYSSDKNIKYVVAAMSQDIIDNYICKILSNYNKDMSDECQNIYDEIRKGYSILLIITSVLEKKLSNDLKSSIRKGFKTLVDILTAKSNSKQSLDERISMLKGMKYTLNHLYNALMFCKVHGRYDDILYIICRDLKYLLVRTKHLKEKGKPLGIRKKLVELIPAYSAYNLSRESIEKIKTTFPPKFDRIKADHVTHEFGISFDSDPPPMARAKVVGYASNNKVEAAIVEINGSVRRPDNKIYHITISYDPKLCKQNDSNYLLENGWDNVEPFIIYVRPNIN